MRTNSVAKFVVLASLALLSLDRVAAADATERRTVVIYAANTPHETRLREMVETLQGNDDQEIRQTVARIENDLSNFPPAAKDEIAALREVAQTAKFDLVVLTNESLRAGRYELIKNGQAGAGRVEASQLGSSYTAYPLTDASVFSGALRDVANHFSPATHEFALIVKSHGNEEFALVSMLSGKIDIQSADRLVAALKNAKLAASAEATSQGTLDPDSNDTLDPDSNDTLDPDSNDTLDPDSNDTLDPDSNDTLDPDSNDTLDPDSNDTLDPDSNDTLDPDSNDTLDPDSNDTLDPDSNDTLDPDSNDTLDPDSNDTLDPDSNDTLSIEGDAAMLSGLTKDQFADSLAAAGQFGMRFSLVVLEACHSEFSADQVQVMAPVVTTLITTTAGTPYRNADYRSLPGSNVAGELKAAFAGRSPFAVQELR